MDYSDEDEDLESSPKPMKQRVDKISGSVSVSGSGNSPKYQTPSSISAQSPVGMKVPQKELGTDDKDTDKIKKKPRLPKPKFRIVKKKQDITTTTAPPVSIEIKDEGESDNNYSYSKSKTKRHEPEQRSQSRNTIENIRHELERNEGMKRNEPIRIQDLLHGFQEDVVTLKSSQRQKWEEKLEEIQSQLLFPELSSHGGSRNNFESVSGGDGSVPSKWKSAAALIPKDPPLEELFDESGDEVQYFGLVKLFGILHWLSRYSSGITAGLLTWQIIFQISQMMAQSAFNLSPLFWILYWSLTSILLMVTLLGFVNRTNTGDEFPVLQFLLHFLPAVGIFISYYLSKALDFQKEECQKYLTVKGQLLKNVHLTYKCDSTTIGVYWKNFNYWLFILNISPAFGSLVIYTFLHMFPKGPLPRDISKSHHRRHDQCYESQPSTSRSITD